MTRTHCECGRPIDPTAPHKLSGTAICERCHALHKSWRWSRYNPDCVATGDAIAKKGVGWTAWGGIAHVTVGGRR